MKDGVTPLHIAAQYNRVAIAKLLMEHGADASKKDFQGSTPMSIAKHNVNAVFALLKQAGGAAQVISAVQRSDSAQLSTLLKSRIDLNVQDKGRTWLRAS